MGICVMHLSTSSHPIKCLLQRVVIMACKTSSADVNMLKHMLFKIYGCQYHGIQVHLVTLMLEHSGYSFKKMR